MVRIDYEFGPDLRATAIEDWLPYYVDYVGLQKILDRYRRQREKWWVSPSRPRTRWVPWSLSSLVCDAPQVMARPDCSPGAG
jgi:hypothetical protein